jgi:hypothetical protein
MQQGKPWQAIHVVHIWVLQSKFPQTVVPDFTARPIANDILGWNDKQRGSRHFR